MGRKLPEVNSSSMADIAFLLLIFFLVTTTIDIDKGILHILPPYIEDVDIPEVKKRNVLEVNINSADQLLVEGKYMDITELQEMTEKFLTNNGKDPNLSENPQKAIVSLKNDPRCSYDIYIQVQNEIKSAYRVVRDEAALEKFDRVFEELEKDERSQIREIYPMKFSEAEPEI
jgi:biopolymer transport protein ExbD